ncbi:MAG: hypothetical protein R2699_12735 [Acidimicrobiales bacterium]
MAAATTAELDLVHQAREILEATAEARHAEDGLPSRADAAAQGDLPPQQRKPMPPRPVRTEDITSLVAEAKGALRARQLEQAKRYQEAVAAQRRAIDQGDDDDAGTSPGEAEPLTLLPSRSGAVTGSSVARFHYRNEERSHWCGNR